MRVLILDGPGELGQAIASELGELGVSAVLAGRDPGRYEQALNLTGDLNDYYRAAARATVVVNASGRQDPRLVERAGVAFVEVDALPVGTDRHPKAPVLAGARLVPVLAGLLARDVLEGFLGTEPVEVGVLLGAGDPQSAIDTGSTYQLLGRYFTDPATGEEVLNFSAPRDFGLPDGTRRSLARVNFPDQQMLTAALGHPVRTYFATSDRFTTGLLQGLTRVRGVGRLPAAFHFPGTDSWQVFAQVGGKLSWAAGRRQLPYIARIAALAARRAPTLAPGLHRIHDVVALSDLGLGDTQAKVLSGNGFA